MSATTPEAPSVDANEINWILNSNGTARPGFKRFCEQCFACALFLAKTWPTIEQMECDPIRNTRQAAPRRRKYKLKRSDGKKRTIIIWHTTRIRDTAMRFGTHFGVVCSGSRYSVHGAHRNVERTWQHTQATELKQQQRRQQSTKLWRKRKLFSESTLSHAITSDSSPTWSLPVRLFIYLYAFGLLVAFCFSGVFGGWTSDECAACTTPHVRQSLCQTTHASASDAKKCLRCK